MEKAHERQVELQPPVSVPPLTIYPQAVHQLSSPKPKLSKVKKVTPKVVFVRFERRTPDTFPPRQQKIALFRRRKYLCFDSFEHPGDNAIRGMVKNVLSTLI